jgi:hypothetical protein
LIAVILYLPGLGVRDESEDILFLGINVAMFALVPFGWVHDFRKNQRRFDGFQGVYLMIEHIVDRVRARAEDIRQILLTTSLR